MEQLLKLRKSKNAANAENPSSIDVEDDHEILTFFFVFIALFDQTITNEHDITVLKLLVGIHIEVIGISVI